MFSGAMAGFPLKAYLLVLDYYGRLISGRKDNKICACAYQYKVRDECGVTRTGHMVNPLAAQQSSLAGAASSGKDMGACCHCYLNGCKTNTARRSMDQYPVCRGAGETPLIQQHSRELIPKLLQNWVMSNSK